MQIPTNERRVQEQPAGNVQIQGSSVQATPEAFGAAQAKQIGDLSDAVFSTGILITENANKAKARDAINQAREKANNMAIEALSTRGPAAANAQTKFAQDIQALKKDMEKTFDNPAQAKMFSDVFDTYAMEHNSVLQKHALKETIQYNDDTLAAGAQLDIQSSGLVAKSPDVFGSAQQKDADITANVAALGKRQGLPAAQVEVNISKAREAFHTGVVKELASTDVPKALEYIKKHEAHIPLEARQQVTRAMAGKVEDMQVQKVVEFLDQNKVTRLTDVYEVMTKLNKDGTFGNLNIDMQNKVISFITTRKQAFEKDKNEQEDNAVRQLLKDRVNLPNLEAKKAFDISVANNPNHSNNVVSKYEKSKNERELLLSNPVLVARLQLEAMSDPEKFLQSVKSLDSSFNETDLVKVYAIVGDVESGKYNASKDDLNHIVTMATGDMKDDEKEQFKAVFGHMLAGKVFDVKRATETATWLTSLESGERVYKKMLTSLKNDAAKLNTKGVVGTTLDSSGNRVLTDEAKQEKLAQSLAEQQKLLDAERAIIDAKNEQDRKAQEARRKADLRDQIGKDYDKLYPPKGIK
jgi:hypothetical protein